MQAPRELVISDVKVIILTIYAMDKKQNHHELRGLNKEKRAAYK